MKNKVYIYNPTMHNVVDYVIDEPLTWGGVKNALINPDLSKVKGLKRHHWKFEGDKVVPKTEEEMAASTAFHETNIVPFPHIVEKEFIVERPVIITKEVEKIVVRIKEVYKTPSWNYYIISFLGILSLGLIGRLL